MYANNHKYRPICQLPYCCVPATLQMILYRRGMDIMTQEEIGAELGLRMPMRMRELFTDERITWLSDDSLENFGTQIRKKGCGINDFFGRHDIPLKISKLFKMKSIRDIEEFLRENLNDENDIIVSYIAWLKSKGEYKYIGHFVLAESVDYKNKILMLCDPEIPFWKKISFRDLLYQMSGEIDGRERGFHKVSSFLVLRKKFKGE